MRKGIKNFKYPHIVYLKNGIEIRCNNCGTLDGYTGGRLKVFEGIKRQFVQAHKNCKITGKIEL